MSPTQRSLADLRAQGFSVIQIVERWNPHAKCRVDLFGIIDILAVKDGHTYGIQTTSGTNVSARVKKIAESEAIGELRKANWTIHVHGWAKRSEVRGGRKVWTCRVVDCS